MKKEQKLEGKYAWTVTVGEKGQIVIPKQAREVFGIKPGDSLVLLGDKKKGMALIKTEILTATVEEVLKDN